MLVVIGILAFFGYQIFFTTPPAAVSVDGTATSTGIVGQDILTLVEKLKVISIDQSIFSSPLFSSLTDFGQTLVPESVGRSNPFAALGTSVSTVPVSPVVPTKVPVKTTGTGTTQGSTPLPFAKP